VIPDPKREPLLDQVKDWPILGRLQPPPGAEADMMDDALLPEPDRQLGHMETDGEPTTPLRPDWPMHGLRAFQDLVAKITYKPGYRLLVLDQLAVPHGVALGCIFAIDFHQPNTYRPTEDIHLSQRFHVPTWLLERWGELAEGDPERARRQMLRWVRKALGWHELHERDEWIRVEGAMPFDPHAVGGPSAFRLDP
jgi:hypothetical protein